jgi:hypothetical protein
MGVRDYVVRRRGDRWLADGDWNGPWIWRLDGVGSELVVLVRSCGVVRPPGK